LIGSRVPVGVAYPLTEVTQRSLADRANPSAHSWRMYCWCGSRLFTPTRRDRNPDASLPGAATGHQSVARRLRDIWPGLVLSIVAR